MPRDFADSLIPPCDAAADYACFSRSLRALLDACVSLNTTDTKSLAKHLRRSPATINTQFKIINQCFGTNARGDALLTALNLRLIQLKPPPQNGLVAALEPEEKEHCPDT